MSSAVNWDSLHFNEQCSSKKKSKMMFTPEDDLKMWNFIAENFLNYGPFEIFSKMKEILGYEHAEKSLYYRFRNILAPNLHFTVFDADTKLQIAKKFSIALNADFVQELSKSWDLVFDSKGNVQEFSWKTPFSIEPGFSNSNRKRSSLEDFPNESKKPKMDPSDPSFLDSLQKMISETVTASNRKLIEELRRTDEKQKRVSSNSLKHYLDGLRGFLNHMNTPELDDIGRRIEILEEKREILEKPIPTNYVHDMLDLALKMIGG